VRARATLPGARFRGAHRRPPARLMHSLYGGSSPPSGGGAGPDPGGHCHVAVKRQPHTRTGPPVVFKNSADSCSPCGARLQSGVPLSVKSSASLPAAPFGRTFVVKPAARALGGPLPSSLRGFRRDTATAPGGGAPAGSLPAPLHPSRGAGFDCKVGRWHLSYHDRQSVRCATARGLCGYLELRACRLRAGRSPRW